MNLQGTVISGEAAARMMQGMANVAPPTARPQTLNDRLNRAASHLESALVQLDQLYYRSFSANQAGAKEATPRPPVPDIPMEATVVRLEEIAARAQELSDRLQLIA